MAIQTRLNPKARALRRGSPAPLRAILRGKNTIRSNSKQPRALTPVVGATSLRMASKATTAIPPPRSTGIPQSKSASFHMSIGNGEEGRTFLPRVEAVAIVHLSLRLSYIPSAISPANYLVHNQEISYETDFAESCRQMIGEDRITATQRFLAGRQELC